MASFRPKKRKVRLPENEEIAEKLLEKHRLLVKQLGVLPDHQNRVLSVAYGNVCGAKEPIRTIDELYHIKGVGDWVIGLMKESFPESDPISSPKSNKSSGKKGKKTGQPKRYVPRKNSAAYAILITLYREMINGKSYMLKQELIDAAEASGLSQYAIGPNKSKAKPGSSSHKDWYTGWSCMTMLIEKELVKKLSSPAKYELTGEGIYIARDCLARSGLDDPAGPLLATDVDDLFMGNSVAETPLRPSVTITRPSTSVAGHSPELVCSHSATRTSRELIQLTRQRQLNYNSEVQPTSNYSEKIIIVDSDSDEPYKENNPPIGSENPTEKVSAEFNMPDKDTVHVDDSLLAVPPRRSNERFLDAYEVVLILDDRELFGRRSNRNVIRNIRSQFHTPVEMKRLPVGDGIWIARHKELDTEYVLDFIVERKNVDDLLGSINDGRYKDQKLRLKKCGLRKLIYLVEGDPDEVDASGRIKTACFTTEILDGFDVQRTTGYCDTEKTYGHLTRSIIDYYSAHFSIGANTSRICLTFDEFEKKCNLERFTVSDVFALQLMQVPQVTEETALAVTELFPTLFSLARAYSMLDGDTRAQEEMLKNKSKMVNAGASKNIFELVWAQG